MLNAELKTKVLAAQKNEITEHFIYDKLSKSVKDAHNKKILKKISDEELKHYHFWRNLTKEDIKPSDFKIWKYFLISKLFGITFGIKLMENGEKNAQVNYEEFLGSVPGVKKIIKDEEEHENKLINLIDEEKLKYVGSIVLGLNDALVELTGALAGFTLALQNSKLVAITGMITGIAASLSMAASEYLSKTAEGDKTALKASVYTGIAYILTVLFLIAPFFLSAKIYLSLGITIFNAILVILFFTFYTSVAKDIAFKRRFLQMAFISLGVAALTFGIGYLVNIFLHVNV